MGCEICSGVAAARILIVVIVLVVVVGYEDCDNGVFGTKIITMKLVSSSVN